MYIKCYRCFEYIVQIFLDCKIIFICSRVKWDAYIVLEKERVADKTDTCRDFTVPYLGRNKIRELK